MTYDEYKSMRAKYPEFLDSVERLLLEKANVPEGLYRYIPYAEVWGVTDDLEREELVNRAPEEARADVMRVVAEIDEELDEWLAGPDAESADPSQEYMAFSAMRMAVDFM
jgi:hypothetical protein